jgi:hypothetical protein
MASMIVVRIHGWDSSERWTKVTGWYVRNFAKRIADCTELKKPDCEALAKRVLRNRECCDIPLAKARDRYDATSIRSFLDSFGADTSVVEL